MAERVICLLIGYACGLFQTAYIYGRMNHIDIRKHGSGNAGTTNALRTLGKKAGIITFLGDFLKPMVAALLAWLVFRGTSETILLLEAYAGVGAVLGHVFPFYLGFRGGKGIATIGGTILLFCIISGFWYVILGLLVIFIGVVAATRYVSLGSILLVSVNLIWMIVLGQTGHIDLPRNAVYEIYVLIAVYTAIAIIKHRSNIARLVKGEENKLSFHKKEN